MVHSPVMQQAVSLAILHKQSSCRDWKKRTSVTTELRSVNEDKVPFLKARQIVEPRCHVECSLDITIGREKTRVFKSQNVVEKLICTKLI